jgi:hypothetical protein
MIIDIKRHAAVEHEIWSSWMFYMFTRGDYDNMGRWIMPKEFVDRWTKQLETPYSELSEQEQKSDIEQVYKHLYLDNNIEYIRELLKQEGFFGEDADKKTDNIEDVCEEIAHTYKINIGKVYGLIVDAILLNRLPPSMVKELYDKLNEALSGE